MERIKVQDNRFQPKGIETVRTLRLALLGSFIPMGNNVTGADKRVLFKMWLVHICGSVVFPFLVRHEHKLNLLYLRLRRFRR
jgi:hypothetical protein